MNASQMKYLKERLSSIRNDKFAKLPNRYGFTREEKAKLFAEGKCKVEKIGDSYHVVFAGEKDFINGSSELRKKIDLAYQDALDELMLGDVQEALALLKKFEELVV